ncbi:MAG: ISAzo13 family transposase [Gammaproteobacteria bacterium]|nr:ISAzo13 family transposase [Gammaproteobacteria bacterium]
MDVTVELSIKRKFQMLEVILDERSRRLWAAAEVSQFGHGGVSAVARATGLSRTTIYQGMRELEKGEAEQKLFTHQIRAPGGGRQRLTKKDPQIMACLQKLVEPTSRGDPESPLRWICKSTRQLADSLKQQGHTAGRQKVSELLKELGYSLQANRKTLEGRNHIDRDAQFNYINRQVEEHQKQGQPVISVDTKKKEQVGNFKNSGREWHLKGEPEEVRDHDFMDRELGKVNPYGVFDQTANIGWVSVGIDHDTAEFAVESIRRWWFKMGVARYPDARELLVTADGGGSNGYRVRLWKVALQKLSDEIGLTIQVCHFPPGTSKWNKIEHRMFSFISMNWRGKPLISHEVIVNLIGSTCTKSGLMVKAELDTSVYPKGIRVSDKELSELNLTRADFHGEWNYSLAPNCSS